MDDSVLQAITDLEAAGQTLANADAASDTAGRAVDQAQQKLTQAQDAKTQANKSDTDAAMAYDAAVDVAIGALANSKRIKNPLPAGPPAPPAEVQTV